MHLFRSFGKIGGAVLLLSFCFLSCSKPEPVRFAGYRNFHFSSQGFTTGLLQADLALYNPNPYPLKVKEAQVTLSVNEESLGRILQDSIMTMPARDTFLMPVKLQFNLLEAAGKFLRFSGRDSVLLEARGSYKVGRSGVFIKLPLHYRQKESLKLF